MRHIAKTGAWMAIALVALLSGRADAQITVSGPVTFGSGLTVSGAGVVSVASSGVSAGTYGSSIQIPQLAIGSDGRVTGAANLTLAVAPSNWTPTDASGAGLSWSVLSARYTKIGNVCVLSFDITYPTTTDTSVAKIGNLPSTCAGDSSIGYQVGNSTALAGGSGISGPVGVALRSGSLQLYDGNGGGSSVKNSNLSAADIRGEITIITQ